MLKFFIPVNYFGLPEKQLAGLLHTDVSNIADRDTIQEICKFAATNSADTPETESMLPLPSGKATLIPIIVPENADYLCVVSEDIFDIVVNTREEHMFLGAEDEDLTQDEQHQRQLAHFLFMELSAIGIAWFDAAEVLREALMRDCWCIKNQCAFGTVPANGQASLFRVSGKK